MTYVDRVADELETLARCYAGVALFGAVRGERVRKPGRPVSQAPTDLDVLSWLQAVEAAATDWLAETDRVLSVTPVRGAWPARLRDLAFKVRVVTAKQGATPTWCPDVFRLSRAGRHLSGESTRFVHVFEQCPACGGELVADPERWVLVCLGAQCRDQDGRRTTFAIDAPVGLAQFPSQGVRSDETQGEPQ
ncbi:hypothetical protein [Brachybacterium nesterenkovii]|uniref:hypothetical protein n=1 Tax=Brachybacterium nesterenkovii TaxID=47847 RepID=UPI00321938AF